ncbi:unnamed protein product [Gadus morhua 'NCC']
MLRIDLSAPQPVHQKLYELDHDEKRKEFLDDLFSFMQKRGTPVNRIPIMAKQVLDLYTLYTLVTEKGGLVEVINKKIWREITKGLHLPTSITSAAFTLRTQYMKYLYPYECERRGLSSPGELQAAIDSNRREGRRQNYGSALFNYSPMQMAHLAGSTHLASSAHLPGSAHHSDAHLGMASIIKKEDRGLVGRGPLSLGALGGPGGPGGPGGEVREPPEKRRRMSWLEEEQQRLVQHTLHQNLIAMATQLPLNIRVNSRDDRQARSSSVPAGCIRSINMSIELNGVVYTGLLFARKPGVVAMGGAGAGLVLWRRPRHSKCSHLVICPPPPPAPPPPLPPLVMHAPPPPELLLLLPLAPPPPLNSSSP